MLKLTGIDPASRSQSSVDSVFAGNVQASGVVHETKVWIKLALIFAPPEVSPTDHW
jgi:hypothetical protein